MPPLFDLERRLAKSWPPEQWQEVALLLAISGGADSVAMLRAILAVKTGGVGRIVVAHFNHALRGKQSDADQRFVLDLCQKLAVPCEIGCAAPEQWKSRSPNGIEEAARSARYAFLQQTADRVGARYVLTAHTADDQAETILHRILRGTGILGLSGMERARPLGAAALLRPLLTFRRADLLAYLQQLGQPYCVDTSNLDLCYTRNRIRRQLLPELATLFNPGIVEALLRLGRLAGEVHTVVNRLVEDLYVQSVQEVPPGSVRVSAKRLAERERYLLRQVLITAWHRQGWPLRSMGYQEWDLMADMLLATGEQGSTAPRKHVFPGGVLAEIVDDALRLTPQPDTTSLARSRDRGTR